MRKVFFTLAFFVNYLCAADNFQSYQLNYDDIIGYREPPPSPLVAFKQCANEVVEYQKKALLEALQQKNLINSLNATERLNNNLG